MNANRYARVVGLTCAVWLLVLPPRGGSHVMVSAAAAQQPRPVASVLVVTMDGMRWQEVFEGLHADLLSKEAGGVTEEASKAALQRFGGPAPEDRRQKLMPFFWSVVAKQGQIFGDPSHHSLAHVTNGLWFSYPGYNEMLSGAPDPRVDSNDKRPNPNVTVLEWLNHQASYAGQVAAFGSWEVLPFILNEPRSGIPSNGDGPPITKATTEREQAINEFAADLPPYWGETRFDAPTGLGALEYLRRHHPRVLYVMLGETDEWAHGRRYDLYLDAAERNDRFIRKLWETAQSMPQYANRTALVLTTDHGRGDTATDWTDHGRKVPAAERIWMAVMGPGVPSLGVRSDVTVTQSQIAATIAALLGEDYGRASPQAAPPLDLQR
jgi:Type I phosphodiesterase / nucleotide pyrophosphatase